MKPIIFYRQSQFFIRLQCFRYLSDFCWIDAVASHNSTKRLEPGSKVINYVVAKIINWWKVLFLRFAEAAVWRCPVKKVFLEILESSQEKTCARISLLIKLQTWGKKILWHRYFPVNIAKFLRAHFYRTPLVAASVESLIVLTYLKSFFIEDFS